MRKKKIEPNKLDSLKLFNSEQENLDFPAICKFIRSTLNVTQQQMAEKLGTTLRAYTHWEYGKRLPGGWQAFNLCLMYLYAKEVSLNSSQGTSQDIQENAA